MPTKQQEKQQFSPNNVLTNVFNQPWTCAKKYIEKDKIINYVGNIKNEPLLLSSYNYNFYSRMAPSDLLGG